MSQVNPPRGMRDFLPAEKLVREQTLATIRETYALYGFEEIETPVMEEIERLTGNEGGDNQKMTFNVLRRRLKPAEIQGATGPGELVDMGLRYDLTVPLSRFYATHRAQLPTVFRAIQVGPVWRAERPQRGRYRQFMQCDIDVVGEAGVLAEAELFQATAATLDRLGIEDWRIRVNSRVFLTALLGVFGVEPALQAPVLVELDKLDKSSVGEVMTQLNRLPLGPTSLGDIEDYLRDVTDLNGTPAGGFADMGMLVPTAIASTMVDLLALLAALPDALQARVVFDPLLIRGMGYYTGTIYEIEVPGLGYSIGGGGRYDGMIGRLSGVATPAVGMSLGFERLIELVKPAISMDQAAVALVYDRDVEPAALLRFKAQLAANGTRVRLEKRPKKLPELLTRLANAGYTAFATIRRDTATVVLKPLQRS